MSLPTTAILPYMKSSQPGVVLEHKPVALPNTQRRLVGRTALVPDLDLVQYRFRAVYDWVEFEMTFARSTQIQHVQKVLDDLHHRKCWVDGKDPGPGATFTVCSIRVQEPRNMASLLRMHRRLVETFGEAASSRVTGVEVSIDAYPSQPSDVARARLLGAMQRTIWTNRDIWINAESRPRSAFGKLPEQTYRLSPEPSRRASRSDTVDGDGYHVAGELPTRHRAPALDGTMYLGSKHDDEMIRLMDKVLDDQRPDGTRTHLAESERRVRVEIALRGDALLNLGIRDIESLRTFKVSKMQARYFKFRTPAFLYREKVSSAVDVVNNTLEANRARTYLTAGNVGLMAMDTARDARQNGLRRQVRHQLRKMGRMVRPTLRARVEPAFVSYDALNRMVASALRDLAERERRAWKA